MKKKIQHPSVGRKGEEREIYRDPPIVHAQKSNEKNFSLGDKRKMSCKSNVRAFTFGLNRDDSTGTCVCVCVRK